MKKIVRRILILFILIVIGLLIGYIAFAYSQFDLSKVTFEDLQNKTFVTIDAVGTLYIKSESIIFYYAEDKYVFKKDEIEYNEGLLTLSVGEEVLRFYVVYGGNGIYNDKYRIFLWEVV